MTLLQDEALVRHYERLFADPLFRAFTGDSGYANFGYWHADTATGLEACQNLVDVLLEHLDATPRVAVDVACGQGGTTGRLLQCFPSARVLGVNLSYPQLVAARRRQPRAGFACCDARRLPFGDGIADLILCIEAAVHFRTREDFLREAYRVLAAGGTLLMTDVTGKHCAGRIPKANLLRDAAAYADLLHRVGFDRVELADVKPQTWTEFCRRYARFAGGHGRSALLRILPRLPWLAWRSFVTDRAIGAYLTVVARRP